MRNGHGNDIYDFTTGKIIADFSSNIPYRNHADEIVAHLSKNLHVIKNYPDPDAKILSQLIAVRHDISPENVLVTNGSAEAFYLTAHLFSGKKTTITYPAFAEYEDACRLHQHELSFLPVEELKNENHKFTDTLWFALPNNPNGYILPPLYIQRICRENPKTHVVIDNAYGDLCPSTSSVFPLHGDFSNLISIHSLTKTFAIPGLRIGYIVAEREIINQLKRLQTPWSVNALAIEAGCFVMQNYDQLLPDSELLCSESKMFQQQLAEISNLEVIPSECNYFLVRLIEGTSAQLKQTLIQNRGILIRSADNFRGLSWQHFRLSVQSFEENQMLIEALTRIFN